ncbi:MAG: hypothetical protein Q7T93_08185 [Methylobacterium sp.]|uniref:hypothetical protein n=1 Tax=Methylobacterium sp. TaxID=409 RepID=UPI00271C0348|nr:hypothetical protein [Methylobacterium sp.]MDO9426800.1 hypothetical protein [Methylobacterium sp.]
MKLGRFVTLLGASEPSRAIWDEVLFEVADCVVAPTLGSIVPHWLLVVPRRRALNFALWRDATGEAPEQIVSEIAGQFGWNPSRIIWFEHGPGWSGSTIGCGVDQAHIHVIFDAPFSFEDLVSAAAAGARLDWRWSPPSEAYRSIDISASYLLVASGDRSVITQGMERVGSQYLRRVIADLVGRPNDWDYKNYPHIENIEQTLSALQRTTEPAGT